MKKTTDFSRLFENFKQQRQYVKKAFDVDGNGKVNSNDSKNLWNTEAKLKKSQNLFDFNGDGKLDQNDIDIFSKGDVDGDGKISQDEKDFMEKYKSFFEKGIIDAASNYNKSSFTLNGGQYKKGVLYVDGKMYTGTFNGLYYKKGKLLTGKDNGINYEKGVAITTDKIPAGYSPIEKIDFSTLKQSSVGECGPLSSIMAIYATENGKNIINNAIKKDAQGNYIVTFKGQTGKLGMNPYNYIISKEEIEKYRSTQAANGSFAVGDDAILAIEIANAKADGDMDDSTTSKDLRYSGLVYDKEYKQTQLMTRLTGVGTLNSSASGNSGLRRAIEKAAKVGNTAMVINIGSNNKTINCIGTPSTFKATGGGHFIAVTGISADGKTVMLTDPVDGSKQYTVTIDELLKITSFYVTTNKIK